jgi:hypothetical protein
VEWVDRLVRLNEELADTLGPPRLVTDPADGITRQTWVLEMPQDALEKLCRVHNAALGWELVADSEGGETD